MKPETFLHFLKDYQAEGLKLLSELSISEDESGFNEKEEMLLDRFLVLWQECDALLLTSSIQEWGQHPLYSDIRNNIQKASDILSIIVISLEKRKVSIQKILEDLPRLQPVPEDRSDSSFFRNGRIS